MFEKDFTPPPEKEEHSQITIQSTPLEIKKLKEIISTIKSLSIKEPEALMDYFQRLVRLLPSSYEQNDELFYLVVDGFSEIVHQAESDFEPDVFIGMLDVLLTLLDKFQNNSNFLLALDDILLLILEIFVKNEAYELLEEYVIYLVNKAIENPDNIIIRSIASEATIIAIQGFGEDWNVEKTKEFDIILRGLLPPNESSDFLGCLLLKGLAIEIEYYGDMQEISSMRRSLRLLKELYAKLKPITDHHDYLLYYAKGLNSAIHWLGENEEFDEMMVTLNELSKISEHKTKNLDLKIAIADGFRHALDYCSVMNDLESVSILVNQLLQLADDSPATRQIQSIAINGAFKAALWLCSYWNFGRIVSLLQRILLILERFSADRGLMLLVARGLFHLTKELTSTTNLKLMTKVINLLEELYQKNSNDADLARYYIQSLINALYLLAVFSDEEELIHAYLSKAEALAETFDAEEKIVIGYSQCFVNAIRFFGLHAKIPEMESLLEQFEDYELVTENLFVTLRLGKAYVDVIRVYGDIGELEKISQIYLTIKEWLMDDQYNLELQIILAKALVNIISAYSKNNRSNEMNLHLDELREITLLYPSVKIIQEQLVKGLAHAIRYETNNANLNRSISMLNEMRSLCGILQNIEIAHEVLARSTRRVVILAYKQGKFELVEELLEALRKLLRMFPKNQTIQVELGRALTSIIIEESNQAQSAYLTSLATELQGLTIQFPENDKLLAIHQTVEPLLKGQ